MTASFCLPVPRVSGLLQALRQEGYPLVGTTVRNGASVHAEIAGSEVLVHEAASWLTGPPLVVPGSEDGRGLARLLRRSVAVTSSAL